MASNVLRGEVKIDAPGVKKTFDDIAASTQKAGDNIKKSFLGVDGSIEKTTKSVKAGESAFNSLAKSEDQTARATDRLKNSANGLVVPMGKVDGEVKRNRATMLEWGRVIQDLPYGFTGIANNLTQIVPAVGGMGIAFSAVVSGLTFAQIGLQNWVRGLGDSKNSIDDNILALGVFASELEDIKEDIDNFTSSLDYANKIGKLNLDINFGKGLKTDLIDLQGQSVGNLTFIDNLEKEEKRLQRVRSAILEKLLSLLSPKEFEAFDQGVLGELDLSDKVSNAFKKFTDADKQLLDTQKKITEAYQNQNVLRAQISQKKIDISEEETKKAEEQRKKEEQGQQKEIANLKKYLEERSRIIGEFSKDFSTLKQYSLPLYEDDPKNDELKRRLQNDLQKLVDKTLTDFNIKIKLDPKQTDAEFNKQLQELSKGRLNNRPTVTLLANTELVRDFEEFKDLGRSIGRTVGGGFDEVFAQIFEDAFKSAIEKGLKGDSLETFKEVFSSFSSIAAQSFEGIAESVTNLAAALIDGGDGIKSFAETAKNAFRAIAKEIIKDIILASILSALSGGKVSFLKAFSQVIGGSHASGLKRVPEDGYIAELHKDEMVVPAKQAATLRKVMGGDFSIPGLGNQFSVNIPTINSTNFSKVNSASSLFSNGSRQPIEIVVSGQLRASGNDLVAVHQKTLKLQGITF